MQMANMFSLNKVQAIAVLCTALGFYFFFACTTTSIRTETVLHSTNRTEQVTYMEKDTLSDTLQTATFGGGCFWCIEAVFTNLNGVHQIAPGYMGGQIINPSYKEVCNGYTGHAEVIQLSYNPQKISYAELLEVFFLVHDPTTLNRQGADYGTQYRSVIFYHTPEQAEKARVYINMLNESGAFENPIVTEISPASAFYQAEEYHHNYYALNKEQPYCRQIIEPKLKKFKHAFSDKLKQKGE